MRIKPDELADIITRLIGAARVSTYDPQAIAARLGMTLIRKFGDGEFGAFLACAPSGPNVVLKVLPNHRGFSIERVARAVSLADALRQEGYPIPRYLDLGVQNGRVFTVQEVVQGRAAPILRLEHAKHLVELWQRQLDSATSDASGGEEWMAAVEEALRRGTEEVFVDHSVLHQCRDPRVVDALQAAIEVSRTNSVRRILRRTDTVHADFHPRNLLVHGHRIAAVFDWEGAHSGDARVDLLNLSLTAPDQVTPKAAEFLRDEVRRTTPRSVRRVLLALSSLQRLTFAVRSRPEALDWALIPTEQLYGIA